MRDDNIIYDLENPLLCGKMLRGIRDAKDVLNGKWKTFIIGTLMYKGSMHFMQLMREIEGIAPRMLSKELQELELHQLIKRTVLDTKPIKVQYEITKHGMSLQTVLNAIADWGLHHRREMIGGDSKKL
ncbi:helix-turn-helix domain-containing protein [Pedobacter sp. MC2016-24]|uniref:winged helix-turn-helix transcriptional regulator n=1 Tax=Pedobacter sp. MC2016-24 TaxID=2780090 RepID=UPI00187EA988|nr:helix-turn-helix domain-containing protein [Pedobacter sp. MC2016-24]MBE9599812.1 helix-turn-helix transcriptional regulator [Pedobacter sp. MC2016-24]